VRGPGEEVPGKGAEKSLKELRAIPGPRASKRMETSVLPLQETEYWQQLCELERGH